MHISEGFLSPAALAAGAVAAGAGIAWGLSRMDPDRIVRVAMASSVFFLASLVNVRIPPGSTHLSLVGAMGLLLGWASFPAIFTALLLQAALFQFGGFLVLGANTTSMAGAAVLSYLLFGKAVREGSARVSRAASFAAGFLGVVSAAAFVAMWLVISDAGMARAAGALFAIHMPIAAVEGVATMFMTEYLKKVCPDVLAVPQAR
ncbi:MAG: cobalt transporter CbiM [Synergistaceae bacterium]|jgi:cobalt/nickel transport system permease protein|nr:cobalt transporter CbiM [Synergistaceae bacterium]